jgi:hypothetical protein
MALFNVTIDSYSIGQVLRSGRRVQRLPFDGASVSTTTTLVTLRAPQYGIPLAEKIAWLRTLLPNGTPRYIGFFTTMPARNGLGGVEAVGSGYVRVAHSSWRDLLLGTHVARRINSGLLEFAPLTDDLTLVGWGAWDSSDLDATLKAFGLLRNPDGQPRIFDVGVNDTLRWNDGELQIGIQ